MSKITPFTGIRIIPREPDFLNRKVGNHGEIFYDRDSNTLRLYNGQSQGGISLAKSDLANVSETDFVSLATSSRLFGPNIHIHNTVVNSNLISGDKDYVTFTVGTNDITALYLTKYVGVDLKAFFAIQEGSAWTVGQDVNQMLTYGHLGPWDPSLAVGSNVLAGNPLHPGAVTLAANTTYTVWIQQTGSNITEYALSTNPYWVPATADLPADYSSDPATPTILYQDGAGQGGGEIAAGVGISIVESNGVSTITNSGIVTLSAGSGITIDDDSTEKIITNTGVLGIVAGSGITTSVNQGVVTINSVANTGSITFVGTTIDSADSSTITFTPTVAFDSDVVVGNAIVFPDGTYQQTSAVGVPGPQGPQGPQGASGAGTGDVLSSGGGYVDNAIIRYDGTTGTIIQNSSATISDAGLLTATSFSGIGSSLTALNATQLTSGTVPDARFPATLPAASGVNLTSLNAANLGSGTVPDARFPATLPAASGTNLTSLNASNLSSGTVPVLRLGTAGTRDATTFLRGDNTWATVASGGGASDSFATIAVAGQSSVVADSSTDTLTLVAGTGITITTDASTDTITITNSGSAANSFSTVAVTGQSNVVADSSTDTLTIAAGTGISITTDAGTDTVTITSTVAAGATAFTGLSDAGSLTVDQFYLPAITRLDVTATPGNTAYRFDQYGTTDDPTIYAINATTIAFNLSTLTSTHPFLIQDNTGTLYNTGLVHVTTAGVVTTGSSAQAKSSGTLYWKIPDSISGNYRYQCQSHGGMVGIITIKNFGSI